MPNSRFETFNILVHKLICIKTNVEYKRMLRLKILSSKINFCPKNVSQQKDCLSKDCSKKNVCPTHFVVQILYFQTLFGFKHFSGPQNIFKKP